METRGKKVMGVVLSALLLFWSVAPVPVGVEYMDRARFQQANANPTVLAPLAIFATALAAYGVYVAGTSTQTYNSNLGTLYNDFATTNNMTTAQLDEMLLGAATGTGKIDMALLGSSFFPLVGSWAAGMVSNGSAVSGTSSLGGSSEVVYIGNYAFPATSNFPAESADAQQKMIDNGLVGWQLLAMSPGTSNDGSTYVWYIFSGPDATFTVSSSSGGTLIPSQKRGVRITHAVSGQVSYTGPTNSGVPNVTAQRTVLNKSASISVNGYTVSQGWTDNAAAVVADGVLNGTVVAPTTIVEPFEPTAAQLEAGYSSADIVEAINSQTGEISDQTGILQGIQTGITAQTGVLQGIQTGITEQTGILGQILSGIGSILSVWEGVQAGPFSWLQTWWNTLSGWLSDVLAWLGDTPLAQLIAQILSAIAAGAADIVSSLAGTLAGVIEAIQAAVGSISAAITAVLDALMGPILGNMGINWTGSPFYVATPIDPEELRQETMDSIEVSLRDKAPFAYMYALNDSFAQVSNSYSSVPSFSFSVDIPYMSEPLLFDAGPWLNYQVGGVTIAFAIRVLVTACICMALVRLMLYASITD